MCRSRMKVSRVKVGREIQVKSGGRGSPPHANIIVFLGGGRITSALLAGLRLARYHQPIVVHDRHPSKLRQLRRDYGVTVEPDLQRAVAQARLLIIAVRPDTVRELLRQIEDTPPVMAVSLAAGISLSKLRRWMGKPVRWARAMPSPVARSGRGLTALTFGRDFPTEARREVRDVFAHVGAVLEIPESKFDAFSVTYSSGQGYHALAGLAEAAQMIGLDHRTALTAAAHALADGILAWREGPISLGDLLREAATPGGIAAATMASMDKSGYRRAVQRGLRAGMERARQYAKG
jgi:pyrroline-5-carboxylate reductase